MLFPFFFFFFFFLSFRIYFPLNSLVLELYLLVADPGEGVGLVFSSSISVPTVVSDGLARNISVGSVSNGGPESSSSVSLVSGSDGVWWNESAVRNNLVARDFEPREVVGLVFFSTVWEPAGVSFGLAGNVSPLCVGNSNVNLSSSVVLESVRNVGGWVVGVGNRVQEERSSDDPVKLVGLVLSASVRIPAAVSNGLARNFSV